MSTDLGPPKPATTSEVSTDSDAPQAAISADVSTDPTRAPSASACEPYRDRIAKALGWAATRQARFRDPERSLDRFDFDFNKKMCAASTTFAVRQI